MTTVDALLRHNSIFIVFLCMPCQEVMLNVLGEESQGADVAFAGYLADLESAAWKDDRAFRLLTVHAGVLSFSDYFFSTSGKARPGVARSPSHTVSNASFSVSGQGSIPASFENEC